MCPWLHLGNFGLTAGWSQWYGWWIRHLIKYGRCAQIRPKIDRLNFFFIISRRREGRTWLRTEARKSEGAAAGIPAPERQRRAQAAGPHVPFARLRSAIGGDLDSLPRELRRKPQEAARVWGRGGELGISSSCGRRPPAACVFSGPRVREYMIIYTGRTLCGP